MRSSSSDAAELGGQQQQAKLAKASKAYSLALSAERRRLPSRDIMDLYMSSLQLYRVSKDEQEKCFFDSAEITRLVEWMRARVQDLGANAGPPAANFLPIPPNRVPVHMVSLAQSLEKGYGVQAEPREAVALLRAAADRKYLRAVSRLEVCYKRGLQGTTSEGSGAPPVPGIVWYQSRAKHQVTELWAKALKEADEATLLSLCLCDLDKYSENESNDHIPKLDKKPSSSVRRVGQVGNFFYDAVASCMTDSKADALRRSIMGCSKANAFDRHEHDRQSENHQVAAHGRTMMWIYYKTINHDKKDPKSLRTAKWLEISEEKNEANSLVLRGVQNAQKQEQTKIKEAARNFCTLLRDPVLALKGTTPLPNRPDLALELQLSLKPPPVPPVWEHALFESVKNLGIGAGVESNLPMIFVPDLGDVKIRSMRSNVEVRLLELLRWVLFLHNPRSLKKNARSQKEMESKASSNVEHLLHMLAIATDPWDLSCLEHEIRFDRISFFRLADCLGLAQLECMKWETEILVLLEDLCLEIQKEAFQTSDLDNLKALLAAGTRFWGFVETSLREENKTSAQKSCFWEFGQVLEQKIAAKLSLTQQLVSDAIAGLGGSGATATQETEKGKRFRETSFEKFKKIYMEKKKKIQGHWELVKRCLGWLHKQGELWLPGQGELGTKGTVIFGSSLLRDKKKLEDLLKEFSDRERLLKSGQQKTVLRNGSSPSLLLHQIIVASNRFRAKWPVTKSHTLTEKWPIAKHHFPSYCLFRNYSKTEEDAKKAISILEGELEKEMQAQEVARMAEQVKAKPESPKPQEEEKKHGAASNGAHPFGDSVENLLGSLRAKSHELEVFISNTVHGDTFMDKLDNANLRELKNKVDAMTSEDWGVSYKTDTINNRQVMCDEVADMAVELASTPLLGSRCFELLDILLEIARCSRLFEFCCKAAKKEFAKLGTLVWKKNQTSFVGPERERRKQYLEPFRDLIPSMTLHFVEEVLQLLAPWDKTWDRIPLSLPEGREYSLGKFKYFKNTLPNEKDNFLCFVIPGCEPLYIKRLGGGKSPVYAMVHNSKPRFVFRLHYCCSIPAYITRCISQIAKTKVCEVSMVFQQNQVRMHMMNNNQPVYSIIELTEYMDDDLESQTKKYHQTDNVTSTKTAHIKYFLEQTLQTLEVMHKEKVAFTDLKPGNLFLLGGIRICLSDIKSLIPYDHPEPTYENTSPLASSLTSDNLEENYNPEQEELPLLTPVFAPPEAYKNANYKNANIKWLRQGYDWFLGSLYSLGMTFFQLMTGLSSAKLLKMEPLEKISYLDKHCPYAKEKEFGVDIARCVRILLDVDPKKRARVFDLWQDISAPKPDGELDQERGRDVVLDLVNPKPDKEKSKTTSKPPVPPAAHHSRPSPILRTSLNLLSSEDEVKHSDQEGSEGVVLDLVQQQSL